MASVEVQWQGLDGKPVDSNALVLQHLKNNGYNVYVMRCRFRNLLSDVLSTLHFSTESSSSGKNSS